ncbi:MAG: hypothetical protein GEV11_27650 [Streptosporangiales bacterium]|nr:hypothetical protein [Streptosporangiales bacterium]
MRRDYGAQRRQLEVESEQSAARQREQRTMMEVRAAEMERAQEALRDAERRAAEAKEAYLRSYHHWWDAREDFEQEQRRASALAKRLRRTDGHTSLPRLTLPDLPH